MMGAVYTKKAGRGASGPLRTLTISPLTVWGSKKTSNLEGFMKRFVV
jgi:hypothetical protein